MFKPKPHVSVALRRLRLSVLGCAAVLASCILLQMLVWAFVSFTDARWTTVESSSAPSSQVVQREPDPATPPVAVSLAGQAQPASTTHTNTPKNPNLVLSRNDRWFTLISGLAQTAGVIAALLLTVLMLQAVVLAASASVPGVEMAVTASTWSVVIALLCLPLADVLPSMPYRGIFSSYAHIIQTVELRLNSASGAPSAVLFYSEFLFLPAIALIGVVIVAVRFTIGIEQGSIVTSMSELEEKLDREMSSVKLVSGRAPRAVGALHKAIGDDASADELAPSLTRSRLEESDDSDRSIGKPSTGTPMTRPI